MSTNIGCGNSAASVDHSKATNSKQPNEYLKNIGDYRWAFQPRVLNTGRGCRSTRAFTFPPLPTSPPRRERGLSDGESVAGERRKLRRRPRPRAPRLRALP